MGVGVGVGIAGRRGCAGAAVDSWRKAQRAPDLRHLDFLKKFFKKNWEAQK